MPFSFSQLSAVSVTVNPKVSLLSSFIGLSTVLRSFSEPVFRVMTKKGSGSMNRYGVVWGSYLSEEGNATVTMLLDEDVENPKEAVMEVIGSALLDLAGIEKALPGVIEEIREKQKRIEAQITRV